MQESNEHRRLPLLLVVLLRRSGCLKSRHFDKYTRHLHCLLWNAALCAQGYPQKMWNENSHAIPILNGEFWAAVWNSLVTYQLMCRLYCLTVLMLGGWTCSRRCELNGFAECENDAEEVASRTSHA